MSEDGWYQATKPAATFGFLIQDGKVVIAAPYLRRFLIGQRSDYALDLLRKRGFEVEEMPGQDDSPESTWGDYNPTP